MGKQLIIKGADFSENSLAISKIEGTAGYVLTPSMGSGSFTINQDGYCYLPEVVTPDANGYFALGTYNTDNPNITKIVAAWDVQRSGITKMALAFCFFSNLEEIDCNSLDVTGITDYTHMFRGASKIERIDLSTWGKDNPWTTIITAGYMFNGCTSLKWLDLGYLKFGSSTVSTAFAGCSSLQKVRSRQPDVVLGNIANDLNAANAGGSNNWVIGVDTDGCAMLTPST